MTITMKPLRLVAAAFALAVPLASPAGDGLEVKFRSRALLDAMASGYGKDAVQGYFRLEDFRVGFKAGYGRYGLKADIGLGGGKTAVKDLLFDCRFNNCVLSVGNGYEPFSMEMLISTADLRFHQSASSALAFADSRKLGVTLHYSNDHCYLATGVYTNNDINHLGGDKKNSLVSTSRAVWRRRKGRSLVHAGAAFSFRTKDVSTDAPVRTVESAGVTSMFGEPLLYAEVDHAGTELKGLVEVLYTSRKTLLQGEYFYNRVNRTGGLPAYRAHGGYVQCSYLLAGEGFEYDAMYGIPGRPSTGKAVELTARFNYAELNDGRSGIYGGGEKDLSLGVNIYLNKFLGFKLNGSYVWVGSHCGGFYDKDFFLAQARLQYIF